MIRAGSWSSYLTGSMFRTGLIIFLTRSSHIRVGWKVGFIFVTVMGDSFLRLSLFRLFWSLSVTEISFIGSEGVFKIFLLRMKIWFWILSLATSIHLILLVAIFSLMSSWALFITSTSMSMAISSLIFRLSIRGTGCLFYFSDIFF